MTEEHLEKHGFLRSQDMFLTENNNQAFFLRLGNMVHSYMQYVKSLSAISY